MAKVKFITSLLFILIFNFNLKAKEINTKELKNDLKTPKEDSKKIESQKEDNKKEAKKEKPKAEPKTLSPSVAPQVPAVPTVPPVPSVPKVQAAEKKEAKLKPKPSHQKPGEPLVTILFMDWNALDVFLIKMDANKIYYCKNKNELSAYKTGKGKSHSSSFDEILDINFHGLKNKGVQKIQGILKASMDDVDIYKDLDIAVDLDFNSPREVPNQKKPDNTGTIKLGLGEKYRKNTKNYTLEFDFGLSLDFDSTRDGKNQTEAIIKIEDKSSISSMSGVSSSQSSSNPQASTSSASHTATSHGPSGGSSSQGMSSVPGLGSASLTYSAYLKEKLFLFGQGLFSYSTEKIGDKDQDPYLGAMFGGGIGRINNLIPHHSLNIKIKSNAFHKQN